MTDAEFNELVILLRSEITAVGLQNIAEDEMYLEGSDDSDRRLPNPKRRLVMMLSNLEHALLRRDRKAVSEPLRKIQSLVEGKGPTDAVLEIPEATGTRIVSLSELPDLASVIGLVRHLRITLSETPETI